ncbi:type VII secretion protein EccE [Dactylosporangium sp. NPDC051541]|uniref:type VII secretion protein EccE n=1 Tax=Dactylosporangium sp. NPDC051541 TaxID=3363977 RepID=UPI003799D98B
MDEADVGVLEDIDGLAAIVRVGDLSALFGTVWAPLPSLSALLPPPGPGVPAARVQLLVTAVTAPRTRPTSPSADSYRQLSEGRVLAQQRVLIAVRVRRAGGFQHSDLEQTLLLATQRIVRLLTKAGLPARPLATGPALAALAEAAQHDPVYPVRESRSRLEVGGLEHAVFRIRDWPEQPFFMERLLMLPTAATTVSVTAQFANSAHLLASPAPDDREVNGDSGRVGVLAAIGGRDTTTSGPLGNGGPRPRESGGAGAWNGGGSDARGDRGAGARGRGGSGARGEGGSGAWGGGGLGPPGLEGETVRAECLVRLAAPSSVLLAYGEAALRQLAQATGAQVSRLNGARVDGLAATLPLGGGASRDAALLAGLVSGQDVLGESGDWRVHQRAGRRIGSTRADGASGAQAVGAFSARAVGASGAQAGGTDDGVGSPRGDGVPGAVRAAGEAVFGGDGVMLGVDRHRAPLVVRLFRPEPTRVALVGGVRCAQMVVLRALAVGARVLVQSARPQTWEPFLRALGNVESLSLIASGPVPDPPPATATSPQLLLLDVGPVPGQANPILESPWRTMLFLRNELTTADSDLLIRSDLTLLQPLTPPEADLAAGVLDLHESHDWFIRVGPAMLAVVANRETVRWTHLAPTPLELQLIGPPTRPRPRIRPPRRTPPPASDW